MCKTRLPCQFFLLPDNLFNSAVHLLHCLKLSKTQTSLVGDVIDTTLTFSVFSMNTWNSCINLYPWWLIFLGETGLQVDTVSNIPILGSQFHYLVYVDDALLIQWSKWSLKNVMVKYFILTSLWLAIFASDIYFFVCF